MFRTVPHCSALYIGGNNIKYTDITGLQFGRLTVICKAKKDSRAAFWLCECQCGKRITVKGSSLRSGHTKSCGCLHDELSSERTIERNSSHSMSKTRIYSIWGDMRKRCRNKHHWAFERYGGRGINVCEEWENFSAFYKWSSDNGYSDELSIDRINNDGDYCPQNCRWATKDEQANNRSNNRFVEHNGKRITVSQLSKETGIPYGTLYSRIFTYGFSVDDAVFKGVVTKHGA